jgi:predicted secreted protein
MISNKNRILFIVLVAIAVIPAAFSKALPYGSGTYGTCQYSSCSIAVTSNGTVSLAATPTTAGVYSTQSDTITVTTGTTTGYTLKLNMSGTSNSLIAGSFSIPASSGSLASPVTRTMNTWGYRVDGAGGFGAGPTSTESSAASSSYTFAAVPTSVQSGDLLKSTSSAAGSGDTTTVWYGMAANASQPSGTYTASVVYTATTN